MTAANDELDYVSVVDAVLSSIPAAYDMDRGQALRVYNTVAELDGLLISGAPAAEIEDAVTRFDNLLNHRPMHDGQQHLSV